MPSIPQSHSQVTMSLPSQPSPPKRPRLSLQTKAPNTPQVLGKSITALKLDIDPSSPTTFNTLSNAYAAAIENSSPRTARPLPDLDPKTAINTARPTSLRLRTSSSLGESYTHPFQRTQTPGPFSVVYPDTPRTAYPDSPGTSHPDSQTPHAQDFNYTPPQSAKPPNETITKVFTFNAAPSGRGSPISPRTPRRRATIGHLSAPYTHPRSLHSILRNSPLPPRSTLTPISARRLSNHLANCNSKRVGYNDPLTQTITTNKYVKSHIDLLAEEASPFSPNDPEAGTLETLDLAIAQSEDNTRDGGQTPGPFEEMRRRMAGLGAETDSDGTSRKRKRKEKKRQWVWTIGVNTEEVEVEGDEGLVETPTTAIKRANIHSTVMDLSGESSDDTEMLDRPGTSQSS